MGFEESWADQVAIGPTGPSGDLAAIATELLARYASRSAETRDRRECDMVQ